MKQIKYLAIILALTFAPNAHGATGCTYPTSLDTFVDKSAGDSLTVADVNEFRCGIEKIQAELGALPKGTYGTVVLRLNAAADKNGLSGGQTIKGGLDAGDDLTLQSTNNATKGSIIFGTASAYDEVNDRLGIGTLTPSLDLVVQRDATAYSAIFAAGTSSEPNFFGRRARNTNASPQAVQANDVIVQVQGQGYDSAAYQVAGYMRVRASENWSGSQRGSQIEWWSNQNGTTTLSRLGLMRSGYGLEMDAGSGYVTLQEESNTPSNPTDGNQMRFYMKADKFVIVYNDAATVRYKYLDLTGTGATWTHTTTPP